MKSKTFSGRSLRSSLKGSTWILVLLLLGFMVAFPVAELMLIGNQTDEIHRMTSVSYTHLDVYKRQG